ncbi:asparagine synthase (glutamine-hydrolyzing) [Planctomicrobium piriforme]|uniref:asparagine synthase (glutamine-hydrolyzing) n=1 Tax=Planctomicrobium piriforme TaxID=1576369 RepID=A0A1I3D8B1_9PLAN|nr:asparagine synthase (glutamine-hydrolyzing) [Planctomicrobium piriforme]SFH82974.1 asparagine synthase (glutamine-hydrolysing) [Planctomicrobium piriforme]
MCGIAGAVWSRPEDAVDRNTLTRMTTAIQHRGPDDYGLLFSSDLEGGQAVSAQCGLGHRRLSIIDLGGGHQPLGNEDGTVWTVFNGEIYNYRELREELIARGHKLATSSDTEVIVHLYEELGPRCVEKMRGMFAFAVWDQRRGRLLLARDRMGQKPLFYRQDGSRLLFGSELKAILQVPGLPREVDPRSIDLFLTYQYVPHPHTIFKGYHKLPPAHVAVFEQGELTVSRYWEPPYAEPAGPPLSPEKWRQELRATLTESVRLRMRSDVPVGAFLSGGIDSTIIAGLMQSQSERPIHTFSIGFPIKEFDERSFARQAAEHLKTDHHEYLVEPSALGMLPKLIWHYDEPFGDSSAIPTMYLSEVTRQVVKVALSGDGGDELFAGYSRYQAVHLAAMSDWLPSPIKSLLGWRMWQQIPTSTRQGAIGRRAKRFIEALSQSPERRYLRWIGIFDQRMRNELYTPEFLQQLDGYDSGEFIHAAYAACPDRDFVTRTTCADVLTYLPCDILTKVDIASMAYALEARSPFLDHRVAELAARMPIELKFQPGRGKKILVETFQDLLPPSIQQRPKMGFGVPIDHWMRNEYRQLLSDLLLSQRSLDRGLFRKEAVERLIQEHLNNRWDHAYRLWNLLCLELWHRVYVDEPVPLHAPEDLLAEG